MFTAVQGLLNEYAKSLVLCARKRVPSNSKAIDCDDCGGWTHIKCCDMSSLQYDRLVNNGESFSFICTRCAFQTLPNTMGDTSKMDSHECMDN